MNPAIAIRRMTAEDITPVMELAAVLEHVPRWSRSSWLRAADGSHVSLLAADPAGIQGFAIASLIGFHAELETIAVVPASRRQGIARKLLTELVNFLRRSGIGELWLEVRVSNEAAIRLYRCFGFEETGRRVRYYTDPVEDAVLMGLALD